MHLDRPLILKEELLQNSGDIKKAVEFKVTQILSVPIDRKTLSGSNISQVKNILVNNILANTFRNYSLEYSLKNFYYSTKK